MRDTLLLDDLIRILTALIRENINLQDRLSNRPVQMVRVSVVNAMAEGLRARWGLCMICFGRGLIDVRFGDLRAWPGQCRVFIECECNVHRVSVVEHVSELIVSKLHQSKRVPNLKFFLK